MNSSACSSNNTVLKRNGRYYKKWGNTDRTTGDETRQHICAVFLRDRVGVLFFVKDAIL